MATIKPVIVPAKVLKGGRHKIRISVSHNGQTRYIVTNIIINSEKEFKGGVVVHRSDASYQNTVLRNLLQQYQQVIDEMPFVASLSCSELVYQITNYGKDGRKTIKEVFDEMISVSHVKPSSVGTYDTHLKRIFDIVGEDMLIEQITPRVLFDIDNKLFKKGLSQTTIRHTMSAFHQTYNFAVRCQYNLPKLNPFQAYKLPDAQIRDCWLTMVEVRHIRDCELTLKTARRSRDLFMLSYYLGGINFIDLEKVNFKACGKHLKYKRTKTERDKKANKFVEFDIPDEALPLIERYMAKDGRLQFGGKCSIKAKFMYGIKFLRQSVGIDKLVYYSARKSFAQHAFQFGVSEGVIDYILGHKIGKAGSSLYSYICVTPEQATNAVRLVLDKLKK